MTRFALLPLAFFANACANSENPQDTMTDDTEEVRAAFDEVEAAQDRRSASYGNRIVQIAEYMFANELSDNSCRYIAAVAGTWRDRTFRTALNVFDTTGHHALRMHGGMQWVDNASGEMFAKGHSAADNMTVALEADWVDNTIDGDMFFADDANVSYRFFGEKRHRGLGGLVIGAVGLCKD